MGSMCLMLIECIILVSICVDGCLKLIFLVSVLSSLYGLLGCILCVCRLFDI